MTELLKLLFSAALVVAGSWLVTTAVVDVLAGVR